MNETFISSCNNFDKNTILGSHGLRNTRVWWGIEISQFLAFISSNIFTLQQLLEDPVEILFHIPNHYTHFWRVAKSVPRVHPCESQKQPKGVNVEVPKCLEFNLASTYLANSCGKWSSQNFDNFLHVWFYTQNVTQGTLKGSLKPI